MKKLLKNSTVYISFILLLILLIVYKSIDNFSVITGTLKTILGVLKPFLIGFIIAYIFNLPCKKIENLLKRSKFGWIKVRSKWISLLTVYLIAILFLVISIRALVPAIYSNCFDLYNNSPYYIRRIIVFLESLQDKLNISIISNDGTPSLMKAVENYIKSFNITEFSKYAQGVVSLTSGVMNIFIAVIVSIYMLIDADTILKNIKSTATIFISEERVEEISEYLGSVNNIFSKFIYCRLIDSLIITVISTLLLSILKIKYALVLGLMIGILNLIPYFGSIISTVIAMIITIVTGGLIKMIWTGVLLLVLQQIDGNYIGPKIMGNFLQIRPLWVIFAVTVGGGLFGVVGMILSVPVFVIIKMIVGDYLKRVKVKKEQKISSSEENE